MDGDASPITEESCPVLLIPRKCTAFEINCEPMENLYLDLNITSIDAEGNVACIYDGCCNVRFLDHYDINYVSNDEPMLEDQLVEGQPNDVWIDPSTSPYVYNHYEETDGTYTARPNRYYVTQDYVTKNVNYVEEIDQMRAIIPQESHYADDELECGKKEEIKSTEVASSSNDSSAVTVLEDILPYEIVNYETEIVIAETDQSTYTEINCSEERKSHCEYGDIITYDGEDVASKFSVDIKGQ
ncbi:unnamed protein product [Leptidea sinapis]|uniref:Uncharacterized protein n=1 Tax=Leptidea sinapis TaxID=189913 RepID=A0A5E4QPJ1_9NEOP|nr:unnamed protein product [Leptidea sinapis]